MKKKKSQEKLYIMTAEAQRNRFIQLTAYNTVCERNCQVLIPMFKFNIIFHLTINQ